MLKDTSMKPRDKSKEAALLEAMAWVVGFSVLLGVFLPDFRHVAPSILFPLGIVFIAFGAYWLGSKPNKAKSTIAGFETTAFFPLNQSGRINQYQTPIFGQPLPAIHFVAEPNLKDKLRALGGSQFEQVLVLLFQNRGFWVHKLGDAIMPGEADYDAAGDVGIDLIIESTAEKYAVQYKHWRKWNADVKQIREFLGSLTDTRFQKGIFISLAGCTPEAKQLAEKYGIQILDEAVIIEMLVESGLMYDHRISELLADENKYCSK
jgi:hypothetical protein